MSSSEKSVQYQFDNSNNSKQERLDKALAALVWSVIAAVAGTVAWTASALPSPLAGRLHPAHVPGAIALLCLVAIAYGLIARKHETPDSGCLPTPAPSLLAMVAAVAAVIVLGLGTRTLGVLPAVFIAAALAAMGVRGVGLFRAVLTGSCLACLAALLFVLALRQPLPLLPGIW